MTYSVSVLVPVYNAEKYVRECLDSLVGQTLSALQIICINDGSTDSSLEILLSYAERFPQIKVLTKPNTGYGSSMNLGLEHAEGEYVGIVEPDDFAAPKMFKRLYHKAKRHDLDLVRADYLQYSSSGAQRRGNYHGFPRGKVFDPRDYPKILGTDPAIWSGIYRRRMLEEEGIRFLPTPGASFQDLGFAYKTWIAARRCMILRGAYLNYRVDNDSSSVKSSAKVFCVCDEHESIESFIEDRLDERTLPLAKAAQQARLGTYRWNYNRISSDQRLPFVQRVSDEYQRAAEKGLLDEACFDPDNWRLLQDIMLSPADFCEKHKGEIPWNF